MAELLALENLCAGYGEAIVISGICLRLEEGRSLAVLGRNGVGKTTLVNYHHRRYAPSRRAMLAGSDITRLRSDERARGGIGWTPQERNIFRSLTVEENLTAIARKGPWTLQRIFEMFPRLAERRGNFGNQLSGGEQQMLAIGRALVLNPRLLLLDEPTEGLAPVIVEELLRALRRIIREEGLSCVVIEQHAKKILGVTDEAIILERGMIVHAAESSGLAADTVTLDRYLGVTGKS